VLLKEDSDIKQVDENIFECANFLDVKVTVVAESGVKSIFKPVSIYQLEKLTSDAIGNCLMDENHWKKVDAIEDYVNSITPFHMGNIKRQRLEKYSSVYISSSGEADDAVDNMTASEILYTAMRVTDGKKDEKSMSLKEQLDNVLGEDACSECKNALNIFGIDVVA
jgi:hypothetical protein